MSNVKPPSTIKPPALSTGLALQPSASVDGAKLSLPAPAPNKPALARPLALTHDTAPEAFLEMGYPKEAWPVLTKVLYPTATSLHSVLVAAQYCKARRLDPLQKFLHIIPLKSGDAIWPGAPLYRVQAHRTGEYVGLSRPEWGDVKPTKWGVDMPEYCGITVYRFNKFVGKEVAYYAEVWATEIAVTDKDGSLNDMWTASPRQQMHKCAEIAALKKGFPEETGGMPTFEEMEGRADLEQYAVRIDAGFEPPPPPPTIEERNETLLTVLAKTAEAQEEPPKLSDSTSLTDSSKNTKTDGKPEPTTSNADSASQSKENATTSTVASAAKKEAPKLTPPKPAAPSSGNQSATTEPPAPANAASTVADTSATPSESTTANQDASATTGEIATGEIATAEIVGEVTEDQLDQLFKVADENGWNVDQVVEKTEKSFGCSPLGLSTKQWADMVDHVMTKKPTISSSI